uniref:DNA 3'-5' helicase n=1 Tax=Chaerephon bat polyomavirus TaxID=3141916 RepID=A0AAU7E366_9POLY
MCPGVFRVFIESVYDAIVEAQPKKRGLIFQGPFDCGKTTVAQAIRDFFMGASLNVNLCKDRLHFELGGAIDMRMVLFDDVTGAAVRGLEGGWGFRNLDSLRDHLDGCVPVGLERKHQQRIEQRFPPWILTCNEYTIPQAILARGEKFTFRKNIADPDGFMHKYSISRAQLVSCDSFVVALCLYLPVDFFPEKCQVLVELLKDDAKECLAEIEGTLLDLDCHEEMPPSPQQDTEQDSNDLYNFIRGLNKRRADEAGEGPSAKRFQ